MTRTHPKVSPAWRRALHEAGHGTAAHCFGWPVVLLGVSRKQGVCTIRPGVGWGPLGELICTFAGPLAECRAGRLLPGVSRRPRRHPADWLGAGDRQRSRPSDVQRARQTLASGWAAERPGNAARLQSMADFYAACLLQWREPAMVALAEAIYAAGWLSGREAEGILGQNTAGMAEAATTADAAIRHYARLISHA